MEEKEFLEKLINDHWEYIKALLVAHEEPESTINMIEFHYRTAFEHGWKHYREWYLAK